MSQQERIYGYVWGSVVDNRDPLGLGRAKVLVSGMFEPHHPEWCWPGGPLGAGSGVRGARTSPTYGQQVALIFENGDPEATPIFFTTGPGAPQGIPAGTDTVTEAYTTGLQEGATEAQQLDEAIDAVNSLTVVWEDENFTMFFVHKEDDKRFVLMSKDNRGYITINASDGAQGKSLGVSIHGDTSVSISSKGVVDISGGSVQIQGRKVVTKAGVTTI